MGNLFKQLSLVFILMVLSIPSAFAVSKSQSKYTGEKLLEQSYNNGYLMRWAYQCGLGSEYKMIGEDVGKLSWEDYKLFN